MAVVNLPAGAQWKRRAWVPPARNQVNESGWTGARTVLRLPGAGLWTVAATLLPITREVDSWPWKAFISVLEGSANTFLMPYGCQRVPEGAGAPQVLPALQGGTAAKGATSVKLRQLPPSTLVLRGGRALTFVFPSGARQLVLLSNDLVANADGIATAVFRGALRDRPADASAVEIQNPVCEMAMTTANLGWDQDEGVYNIAFDAREAFGR